MKENIVTVLVLFCYILFCIIIYLMSKDIKVQEKIDVYRYYRYSPYIDLKSSKEYEKLC